MLTGTTITGLQGSANIDLAGQTELRDITLGTGRYFNVPANFFNVTFDTAGGDVVLELDQANTVYRWDPETILTGANNVSIIANATGISIQTQIDQARIVRDGTSPNAFTEDTPKAFLTFTNMVVGSRVSVFTGGVLDDTIGINATGTTTFATQYELSDTPVYAVYRAGYRPVYGTAAFTTSGQLTIRIEQEMSDGYVTTGKAIHSINGTVIDSNGFISIHTGTKTITFENPVNIREGLSIIAREWPSRTGLFSNNNGNWRIPFDLDSVRGISFERDWTITGTNNSLDEGYVLEDSDGNFTEYNFRITAVGPQDQVRWRLWEDGVKVDSEMFSPAGGINRLKSITPTVTTATAVIDVKNPEFFFTSYEENIIVGGMSAKTFYKNTNTSFTPIIDARVSAREWSNDNTYATGSWTKADVNSTNVTFNRRITISTTTATSQSLINQVATVMAEYDDFTTKDFTVTNGVLIMPNGYDITYPDGSTLAGNVIAFVELRGTDGTRFFFPEQRGVSLVFSTTQSQTITYAVLNATTGAIMQDASANNITGTISAAGTVSYGIPTTVDVNLLIVWTGNGILAASQAVTLVSGGIEVTISPIVETIALYRDETITTDNASAGTKGWEAEIDNITFDYAGRRIIAPNSISAFEINYAYRAWKKQIDADVTRMFFGVALRGVNQEKAADAVDNSHLWNPQWYFNNSWVLDVLPGRLASNVFEIQASAIERDDPANASGVVYAFPLANGAAPVLKIVAGTSTEFQVNTTETLSQLDTTTRDIQDLATQIKTLNDFIKTGVINLG